MFLVFHTYSQYYTIFVCLWYFLDAFHLAPSKPSLATFDPIYNFSFSNDLQVNKGFNLQLSPTGQKVERAANELPWRLAIEKKGSKMYKRSRQCSGSVLFRYGSGSRSLTCTTGLWIRKQLFPSVTFKFCCLFFTKGTFTSVFKNNKSLRSHKTIEIKVFRNFFAH